MSAPWLAALAAVWLFALARSIDFTWVLPASWVSQSTPWLATFGALLAALAARRARGDRLVRVALWLALAGMLACSAHALHDAEPGAWVAAAQRSALFGGLVLPAWLVTRSEPSDGAAAAVPALPASALIGLLVWLVAQMPDRDASLAFLAVTAALAVVGRAQPLAGVLGTYCAALVAATLAAATALRAVDLSKALAVAEAGRVLGRELFAHLAPIAIVQVAALATAAGRRSWPAYVALAVAYLALLAAVLQSR